MKPGLNPFKIGLIYIGILFLLIGVAAAVIHIRLERRNLTTSNSVPTKIVTADSSSYVIISPDGKLIREIKYVVVRPNQRREGMPEYVNSIKGYPTADTIKGDFDGDKTAEFAWLEKDYDKYQRCQDKAKEKDCKGVILFSNAKIKPLFVDYCPMGFLKNEGDINCDGRDEIGLLPGWFTSDCRIYEVYAFRKNHWQQVCEPISNTYNMRESGIVMIEIDKAKQGYAIIRESVDNYTSDNPKNNIPAEYIQGSCCAWSNVVERSIKLK
ncbi:MAG: hypothetical protein WCJ26_12965 [bacterium]